VACLESGINLFIQFEDLNVYFKQYTKSQAKAFSGDLIKTLSKL
jgi:hypothetical protein